MFEALEQIVIAVAIVIAGSISVFVVGITAKAWKKLNKKETV